MNEENHPTPVAPLQLRLGFSGPQRPVEMELRLNGLTVVVDSEDLDLAASHLAAVGIYATMDEHRGLLFPVKDLFGTVGLPPQVTVRGVGGVETLLILAVAPPAADTPVRVGSVEMNEVALSWTDGVLRHDAVVPPEVVQALVAMSVPFVAAADTWTDVLAGSLPALVGTARVSLDRYIEIAASQPQRVESSPLPGLWRIDGTHYGMPLAYGEYLSRIPGFGWESEGPANDRPPIDLASPGFVLSKHGQEDLRELVDGLTADRARAVVWSAGLGRRMFCLAALQSLDAFPALIVCAPWAVWSWRRNLEMINRDGEDAQIVTYEALASWQGDIPATVVFDDLEHFCTPGTSIAKAMHRFDSVLDLYRVAVSANLPATTAELASYMSYLRPAEFDPSVPVALRYPGDPERRIREHAHPYVSARIRPAAGETDRFRRSSVEVLTPSAKLAEELHVADSTRARQLVTLGSASNLSPKIGRCIELVREKPTGRIAVITASTATVTLLSAMLRPTRSAVLEPDDEVFDGVWLIPTEKNPLGSYDLREMDHVIVLDWPASINELEDAVGGPNEGPTRVTILHLQCPQDDRFAIQSNS